MCRCLHGSPALEGKIKFIKQGIDINKYTLRPLRLIKSGGRGYDGKTEHFIVTLKLDQWTQLKLVN